MSIDTIIKVSGAITANSTQNDIASIDIPEDGEILCVGGVILGIYSPSPSTFANFGPQLSAELSFLSTNQIGANDARGTIAGIAVSGFILFSETTETGGGGCKLSEQASICPPEGITIQAGERIHLHGVSNAANLTATATFLLYIKTRGGGRRAVKRR